MGVKNGQASNYARDFVSTDDTNTDTGVATNKYVS